MTSPWRLRARTAEAAAALVAARVLVAAVPFGQWQQLLGRPVDPKATPEPVGTGLVRARQCARHVDRAAGRLPGEFKCLPRAAALQFMLRRRKIRATVMMGVLPAQQRGTLDDLHAWVLFGNEILIGGSLDGHHAVFALQGIWHD